MSRDPLMTWEQPYALDDDGVWCIADESYLLATWGPRCDGSRTINVITGEPAPAPIFVTARNAEILIGEEWSWCLRQALELGVRVIHRGKKRLVPLAEFMAALSTAPARTAESTANDPASIVRAALGVTRVRD